jgi:hypothetical protein
VTLPSFNTFEERVWRRGVQDGTRTNVVECFADISDLVHKNDYLSAKWTEAICEWAWDNNAYLAVKGSRLIGQRHLVSVLVQADKVTLFRLYYGHVSPEEWDSRA